jgi:hypothetical protein
LWRDAAEKLRRAGAAPPHARDQPKAPPRAPRAGGRASAPPRASTAHPAAGLMIVALTGTNRRDDRRAPKLICAARGLRPGVLGTDQPLSATPPRRSAPPPARHQISRLVLRRTGRLARPIARWKVRHAPCRIDPNPRDAAVHQPGRDHDFTGICRRDQRVPKPGLRSNSTRARSRAAVLNAADATVVSPQRHRGLVTRRRRARCDHHDALGGRATLGPEGATSKDAPVGGPSARRGGATACALMPSRRSQGPRLPGGPARAQSSPVRLTRERRGPTPPTRWCPGRLRAACWRSHPPRGGRP